MENHVTSAYAEKKDPNHKQESLQSNYNGITMDQINRMHSAYSTEMCDIMCIVWIQLGNLICKSSNLWKLKLKILNNIVGSYRIFRF